MTEIPTIDTTKAGIYRDLDAEIYHAIDAVSSTRLSHLARSPLYCRHCIDNPPEPTPNMLLGSASHSAVIEPDSFADRYCIEPKCDKRTKEGKAAYADFVLANAGKTALDAQTHERAMSIRDAVYAHPMASKLLKRRSESELSCIWTDKETGLPCKLRADALCPDYSCLVDVKTTQSVSREDFERSIWNFGYWRQLPFYLWGLVHHDLGMEFASIIAVESSAPFDVAVYQLDQAVLDAGWEECRRLMKLYAACKATDVWPGAAGTEIQTIGLPFWAARKLGIQPE